MRLTNTEVQILKELLKHSTHEYSRGFKCACGHVSEEEFDLHNASTQNSFGSMVCPNCGENDQWQDIKVKTVTFNLNKVKKFKIIEETSCR